MSSRRGPHAPAAQGSPAGHWLRLYMTAEVVTILCVYIMSELCEDVTREEYSV